MTTRAPVTSPLVTTEWLAASLGRRNVRVVDGTWHMPVVTSSGSCIMASVLALGLYALGRSDVAVYDGSWTEWGGRADTPVER